MSAPSYTPTIGDAILALAARDGVPGAGFRDADMNFGHALAARYRAGLPVTPDRERAAHRMLGTYVAALADAHIDYATLVPPQREPAPIAPEAPPAASRIAVRGGRIFTSTPWGLKDAMAAIPAGTWHRADKCRQCAHLTPAGNARVPNCPFPPLNGWHYPATPFAAAAIHDAAAPLGYRADRAFEALLEGAATGRSATGLRSANDLPPIPGLLTTAWKHQRQAYWFADAFPGALLDMEMGEQPADAQALTPEGWRKFGDLVVGDLVIGADGRAVRVEEVKPWVQRERWIVHTADGAAVACSPNHLWTTQAGQQAPRTRPLFEIAATLDGPKWLRADKLPALAPIEALDADLPLDPYALGIILAEGAVSGGKLRFRCGKPAIVAEIRRRGLFVTSDTEASYHNITGQGPRALIERLGLTGALSATKRILPLYLEASPAQRLDLLRGLMDGDGSSTPRSAYYSTTSPGLADDVSALARSLGGTGSVWPCGKGGELRVTLGMPPGVDPFLASGRNRVNTRRVARRIVRIERTGIVEPMRCIRVANPDGLYVTDGYVVTHNTGKSLVAVGLMRAKAKRAAIIMCPERVVGVWPKQMRLHAGDAAFHAIDGRRVNRAGRTTFMSVTDRTAAFDHALHECTCGKPHVVIANYAICGYDPFATWALAQQWDAAIFDEIHKIKNPTGKWSKWCAKLGDAASFRAGLTGTLMPHSPLDVFAPLRALDPSLLGTSWTKFRARTVQMGGYGGHEIQGFLPGAEHKLAEQVSRITYRVGAEVLDLPPEVPDVTLECEMSTKGRKVYTQIEQEMYAEIRANVAGGASIEAAITADNVLVKLLRLQQITGGAVRTDDGADVEIDTAKEALLADALSDVDPSKPVVVFAKFRHDLDVIERVTKALGRTYAELSGRRDDALTPEATLEPGVQIAGVQLQAGGTGIDFTASHYAVYYSMGYSLGDYLQSRKRLQRPGQTDSVRFIHLTVTDSIDGDVYDALAKREQVAAYVGGLIRARQDGEATPAAGAAPPMPEVVEAAVHDAFVMMREF